MSRARIESQTAVSRARIESQAAVSRARKAIATHSTLWDVSSIQACTSLIKLTIHYGRICLDRSLMRVSLSVTILVTLIFY